jgi:hypothetical protein
MVVLKKAQMVRERGERLFIGGASCLDVVMEWLPCNTQLELPTGTQT